MKTDRDFDNDDINILVYALKDYAERAINPTTKQKIQELQDLFWALRADRNADLSDIFNIRFTYRELVWVSRALFTLDGTDKISDDSHYARNFLILCEKIRGKLDEV